MLIIPVERKLDWRRPPWVTLALILLNFLIFFACQHRDYALAEQAYHSYQEQQLAQLEAPVYQAYLRHRIIDLHDTHAADELKQVEQQLRDEDYDKLAAHLLFDRDFYHYAQQHGSDFWQPEQRQQWQAARSELQTKFLSQISAERYGLKASDLHAWSFISYQFLHGGWAHIIGNMIFLFIIGFTVESALGPWRYFAAYLATGVVAGGVHVAFSWGSALPLVGASGAISGLMGMYVAIFGRKPIRFFYFLGFYMGYFRAAALWMLVVWLGKQLFDYWASSDTQVAYLAHVGGLVAGAVLVWLLGKSWLQVRKEFDAPAADELELAFRQRYTQALKSVERLAFAPAEKQFAALWQRYPERLELLEHLYQLAKLRPQSDHYAARTNELMEVYLRKNRSDAQLKLWSEYQELGSQPLAQERHKQVFFAALKAGNLVVAEQAFAQMSLDDNALFREEACRLLIEACKRQQQHGKAKHYQRLMDGEVSVLPAAATAAGTMPLAAAEAAPVIDKDAPIEFK